MNLKIISLNIWRYYEWSERKSLLIEYIKNKDPDIIFLQETIYDPAISLVNQTQEINDILNYPYCLFSSTGLKYSQRWKALDFPIQIWQWIISKYKISNIENIFLQKHTLDKENRLLQNVSIWNKNEEIMFSNVHFSNNDLWAESHLTQTLALFEERQEDRILLWDFNIKNLSNYSDRYKEQYNCSSDLFEYESYSNKHESLDYVLLPKKFTFESFECIDNGISDHSPVYFEIKNSN